MEQTDLEVGRAYWIFPLPRTIEPVRAIFAGEVRRLRVDTLEEFFDFVKPVRSNFWNGENPELYVYSIARRDAFLWQETMANVNISFPLVTTIYLWDINEEEYSFLLSLTRRMQNDK